MCVLEIVRTSSSYYRAVSFAPVVYGTEMALPEADSPYVPDRPCTLSPERHDGSLHLPGLCFPKPSTCEIVPIPLSKTLLAHLSYSEMKVASLNRMPSSTVCWSPIFSFRVTFCFLGMYCRQLVSLNAVRAKTEQSCRLTW